MRIESLSAGKPPEPESDLLSDDPDERTAIVSLSELRSAPRKQSKDRHLLVRVRGAELGRVCRLPHEPFRVGRSQDCELWLGDDGVSRKHARIVQEIPGYVIEDTESANGTFVQGQRVTRQLLRDGDVIQFGPTAVFRYTITDESQEALLQQLYDASVTDALTAAHNREHFDTQLRSELSYARRHKVDVSLAFFDVDHFKKVNDTHGHQAGDAVLVGLANTIRGMIRNEDVFARYGGEEFALILRGIDGAAAHTVGERLRERVQNMRVAHEGKVIAITISVGCSSFAELEDKTPESLVSTADKRLYAAKHGGRNRVVSRG
ncbi:MAG TPA: GGDEF domain-containing protein [Polyangiaceae bacterium]|nr:GGDEF domain-containing protein [Polyangiaceae bacterium]